MRQHSQGQRPMHLINSDRFRKQVGGSCHFECLRYHCESFKAWHKNLLQVVVVADDKVCPYMEKDEEDKPEDKSARPGEGGKIQEQSTEKTLEDDRSVDDVEQKTSEEKPKTLSPAQQKRQAFICQCCALDSFKVHSTFFKIDHPCTDWLLDFYFWSLLSVFAQYCCCLLAYFLSS